MMISCSRGNKGISTVHLDANALPMMHGEEISSLISDSGITRLRLTAKVWDMYSNDTASYWHFPEGIYVEKFDSLFQVDGYVKADTAYYFENIELWKLIGNVFIQNMEGTTCETSELFWNRKEPASSINSIYTDKFVRITKKDKVSTAEGMKTNQTLTRYTFYKNAMETTIEENNAGEENDSIFASN
jgi:LPS export ABC transporter protein LptC